MSQLVKSNQRLIIASSGLIDLAWSITKVKHSDILGLLFDVGSVPVPSDEVAAFLVYVKTLEYQTKPDYEHLKGLLAGVVTGRLDFSMPQGPAGESTTKVQDPPTREKVRAIQGQRLSVLDHVYTKLSEFEKPFSCEKDLRPR